MRHLGPTPIDRYPRRRWKLMPLTQQRAFMLIESIRNPLCAGEADRHRGEAWKEVGMRSRWYSVRMIRRGQWAGPWVRERV